MQKHILVTGGAGYIGSHVVRLLINEGYKVTVLDNLVNGHQAAMPAEVNFYMVDLNNKEELEDMFEEQKFDAVMHFAAYIEAGISMKDPSGFFRNNCINGYNLLDTMIKYDVKNFIFSSTAALYGDPLSLPIKEDHPLIPVNHYGTTKLMFEHLLKMYQFTYGLNYISLRYFNAAGADHSGEIGEDHDPETHLIPLILKVALGQLDSVQIFGAHYDTDDGTCVRDYIHVNDLADAHILSLKKLLHDHESGIYNLGNGKGFSVRQVIETAKKVTGINFKVEEKGPRTGDPAVLIADSEKIKSDLSWKPKHHNLEEIVQTAWNWHSTNPEGYPKI